MYSPELMKFILNYSKEEKKSSKKYYNFKDGNKFFGKKYATVEVTVRNK